MSATSQSMPTMTNVPRPAVEHIITENKAPADSFFVDQQHGNLVLTDAERLAA